MVTRRQQLGTGGGDVPQKERAPRAKPKAKGKAKAKAKATARDKAMAVAAAPPAGKRKGKATTVAGSSETGASGSGGGNKRKTRNEKTQKSEETKTVKTPKTNKAKTEKGVGSGEGQDSNPEPRTWAGRWIPSDEKQRTKMMGIKHVFDTFIKHKLRAPSSYASSFFTMCNIEFNTLEGEPQWEDYVAAAELLVEKFLNEPHVRTLFLLVLFFLIDPFVNQMNIKWYPARINFSQGYPSMHSHLPPPKHAQAKL